MKLRLWLEKLSELDDVELVILRAVASVNTVENGNGERLKL
jgi:hypothetical protein